MPVSFSGVEAWSASDQLQPGVYRVKATGVEAKVSSGGNPQVQVDWRVLDGDFVGAEQRDWITITNASMGRVVQLLNAIGVEVPGEEFDSREAVSKWLAGVLEKGLVCEMIVRNESWVGRDGEAREGVKVKGYRPPSAGSSDVDSDASGFQQGPKTAESGANGEELPF
jgi:hypothetical protein